MGRWFALLLTACTTPGQWYSAYQQRRAAEQRLREAGVIVLATVGDQLSSYAEGDDIYTDTLVSVDRGGDLEEGTQLTLRRRGGMVENRRLIVAYINPIPDKGRQVFLLLKEDGEKYEIVDLVPLAYGGLASGRPERSVYQRYLDQLE